MYCGLPKGSVSEIMARKVKGGRWGVERKSKFGPCFGNQSLSHS